MPLKGAILVSVLQAMSAAAQTTDAGSQQTPADKCAKLNRLVVAEAENGRLPEAEAALSRATADMEQTPYGDRCIGIILNNLACVMQLSGSLAKAAAFARRSIAVLETNYNDEPVLLSPLTVLSSVYLEQGELARARLVVHRLQTIRTERPDQRAQVRSMLAAMSDQEGKRAEAELEYLAALEEWEKAGMVNSGETVSVLNNLGRLYLYEGQTSKAQLVLEHALAAAQSALDPLNLGQIKVLNNLAAVHYRLHRWLEAEECLRQAVAIDESRSGIDEFFHATLLSNYAAVLRKVKRKGEAKAIEARLREMPVHEKGSAVIVDVTELTIRPTSHGK